MLEDSFFATLHQDHDEVRNLTAELVVERDPDASRALVERLEALLRSHMYIEENVVFPALLEKITDRDARIIIQGAIADHDLVLHMRKTLLEGKAGEEAHYGRIHALDKLLTHHFDEEEADLYKVARENLTFDDFARLQDRMKAERERFDDETKEADEEARFERDIPARES